MKLITRNTDYAVRAFLYIAEKKGRVVSAGELVKDLGIPRPFLRKILQALNRKGLLASQKGNGGGFKLAKPANKILLTDIMEIFQGRISLNECIFKKRICPNRNSCSLKTKIDSVQQRALVQLRSISIASLIRKG